jgi:hypothetical protein
MREFNLDFQKTTQELQVEKKKNLALAQEKEVLESKIQSVLQVESVVGSCEAFTGEITTSCPIKQRIGNLIDDLDSTLRELSTEKVIQNLIAHLKLI